MLLIPTYVAPSKIHGNGVFPLLKVPKGCRVFDFSLGIDRRYTAEAILRFTIEAQTALYSLIWRSKNSKMFCLHGDDAKYINHSDTPNLNIQHYILSSGISSGKEYFACAVRDIQPGEEITWRYTDFDDIDITPGNLFELIRKNTGIKPDDYDDFIEKGIPLPKTAA